jgi:hypothetical protein
VERKQALKTGVKAAEIRLKTLLNQEEGILL